MHSDAFCSCYAAPISPPLLFHTQLTLCAVGRLSNKPSHVGKTLGIPAAGIRTTAITATIAAVALAITKVSDLDQSQPTVQRVYEDKPTFWG